MFTLLVILATVLAIAWLLFGKSNQARQARKIVFANVGEGVHEDSITRLAAAAITTRYLLVKKGADDDHAIITAADTDLPIGVALDEPTAAEEPYSIGLLGGGARTTRRMVANEAIAQGEAVYVAANGKVQGLPAAASGAKVMVGRALTPASGDGVVIEVQTICPVTQTF
jgi:hypothetical protein